MLTDELHLIPGICPYCGPVMISSSMDRNDAGYVNLGSYDVRCDDCGAKARTIGGEFNIDGNAWKIISASFEAQEALRDLSLLRE
jgi:hypothetical protein